MCKQGIDFKEFEEMKEDLTNTQVNGMLKHEVRVVVQVSSIKKVLKKIKSIFKKKEL